MSGFKREERYIVLKLNELTNDQICDLRDYFAEQAIETKKCVVVEHDWPNYEDVWKTIQQIEEGTYSQNETTSLRQKLKHSKAQEQVLAKFIVTNCNNFTGDHACKKCYPYSQIGIDGFECVFHTAIRLTQHAADIGD